MMNKEISMFAKKKQCNQALQIFQRIDSNPNLQPNIHSYTNLLNAYARCGDIKNAEDIMNNLIQLKSYNVIPNLVTYSTLSL